MAIFNWFSKKEPEDYEQVLSSLALDIQKRQTRLSEIRLRERRTTLLVTIYAFAFWVAYVGVWYTGMLPDVSRRHNWRKYEWALKGIPVFVGPIVIQFTRRIVQTWYTRIGNAEEKTLKTLLTQQRSKVEEIKKKTNYYSTKNLIERYDATPAGSPVRQRTPQQQQQQGPATPQRGPQPPVNGQARVQSPNALAVGSQGTGSPVAGPQNPLSPRKQWYDKLADALLGDDELSMQAAASRYALICQRCFTHNGLVKEELWADTQYVCPKCGHFNPSMRALRAHGSRSSASSPTSPDFAAQQQPLPQPHAEVHQQQRAPGPRKSMPAGAPLLQPDVTSRGSDRRRSMPPLSALPTDDEPHSHAQGQPSRSPLSNTFSLPEEDDGGNEGDGGRTVAEGNTSVAEVVGMEVDS